MNENISWFQGKVITLYIRISNWWKNLMGQEVAYYVIGKDEGIKRLVERFYWHMDNGAFAKECRALHGKSLESSKEKLYLFLSGWFGGPPLFHINYGHPRMRMRHFKFPIGPRERDQWLQCMKLALEEMQLPEDFKNNTFDSFVRFADHMRNKD